MDFFNTMKGFSCDYDKLSSRKWSASETHYTDLGKSFLGSLTGSRNYRTDVLQANMRIPGSLQLSLLNVIQRKIYGKRYIKILRDFTFIKKINLNLNLDSFIK